MVCLIVKVSQVILNLIRNTNQPNPQKKGRSPFLFIFSDLHRQPSWHLLVFVGTWTSSYLRF